MNAKKLSNFLMRVAAVLLVLVLFSTAMVSGRYARYVSSASGSDSARVAKFQITESGDILDREIFSCDLSPGTSHEAEIQVFNDSEVAVDYTITAKTLYGLLPLQYTVTYDGKTETAPFTSVIAPGRTVTFTLNITWPEDQADASFAGKVDCVELTIQAAQID